MMHIIRSNIAIAATLSFALGFMIPAAGQTPSPAAAPAPPSSGGPVEPALIEDLVAASRILADQGVLDAFGHVSIRHPKNPNRYLLSRSRAPALVAAADIMEYDLDNNPVNQRGQPMFVERAIHGEIYKARPDVNAIVHSHSPAVIPFSITPVPLKPVMHTGAFLYAGVPVWDIRDEAGPTDLLVRNSTLGKSLATALADKPVVLMRGHGDVVVGPNVRVATMRAVYTELNARILTNALNLGGPVNYVSDEEGALREKRESDVARVWEFWKAKALGKERP